MSGLSATRAQSLDQLADIFERRGADAYLGEAVTMAEHMLQCAALALEEGAPDTLVAAALLHDVGHFTSALGEYACDDTVDRLHDRAGAEFLAELFPAAVVDCVRLHVSAKRYLCATDAGYFDRLSPPSKHSLALQGGPMRADEIAAFTALPFHRGAVRVRQWDDGGKRRDVATPTLAELRPVLQRVIDAG